MVPFQTSSRLQWIPLFLFLLGCHSSNAVYFHVTEGEERCFLEEVPPDTTVVGHYKSPDVDYTTSPIFTSVPRTGIRIKVIDPSGVILLREGAQSKGRFEFVTLVGGEHRICLSTNTTHWFGPNRKLRFHLNVVSGEMASRVSGLNKNDVEFRVNRLLEKVKAIMAEQQYQRAREAQCRNLSENTNSVVVCWSIAQTAIMMGIILWQLKNIQNFFAPYRPTS